jgi:hypothetical protein
VLVLLLVLLLVLVLVLLFILVLVLLLLLLLEGSIRMSSNYRANYQGSSLLKKAIALGRFKRFRVRVR